MKKEVVVEVFGFGGKSMRINSDGVYRRRWISEFVTDGDGEREREREKGLIESVSMFVYACVRVCL